MKISSEPNVDNLLRNSQISATIISTNESNKNMKLTDSTDIISEMTDEKGQPTKQAYQTAVNKMNEFMEYSHKDSKFVFHDGLEKYYVEIVDSKTDKVVKEIPPKELLDAYYEMQKLIGKMFDTKA